METIEKIRSLIEEGDRLLVQDRNPDAAELKYQEAVSLNRENSETLYSVACAYAQRQNYEMAIEWAHKSIDTEPGYQPGRLALGNALLGLHRYDEALVALQEALGIGNADHPGSNFQAGLCCVVLNKWREAEQ